MRIYKPTWLYVKQHNITGLKYFGKTVRTDPIKYKGSGTRWNKHLAKHGNFVTTIWVKRFDDLASLTSFADVLSEILDIVKSDNWANLRPENGTDGGGIKGRKRKPTSDATKELLRERNLGKKQSAESSIKKSIALKGRQFTQEHLAKLSASGGKHLKGKPWPEARRLAHLNKNK